MQHNNRLSFMRGEFILLLFLLSFYLLTRITEFFACYILIIPVIVSLIVVICLAVIILGFPRVFYIKKTLNNTSFFKNNKEIDTLISSIIKSNQSIEVMLQKLCEAKFEKKDLINYYEVLKNVQETDKNLMLSIYSSFLLSLTFASITIPKQKNMFFILIAIILIFPAIFGSYSFLFSFDILDLEKKRFLLQLYISEYP